MYIHATPAGPSLSFLTHKYIIYAYTYTYLYTCIYACMYTNKYWDRDVYTCHYRWSWPRFPNPCPPSFSSPLDSVTRSATCPQSKPSLLTPCPPVHIVCVRVCVCVCALARMRIHTHTLSLLLTHTYTHIDIYTRTHTQREREREREGGRERDLHGV